MTEGKDKSITPSSTQTSIFPAKVVQVVDNMRVVFNRGTDHGIERGQRFIVYGLSEEELIDPDTNESLGHLEIVRGTGRAVHVQQKMTTLESDKTEKTTGRSTRTIRRTGWLSMMGEEVVTEPIETATVPYEEAKTGDRVRPI